MIHFECPLCAKGLRVKPELSGKKVKCPKCGQAVLVPAEAASPAPVGNRSPGADLPDEKTRAPQDASGPDVVEAPTMPPAETRTVAPAPKENTNPANKPDATQDLRSEEDRSLTEFLAPPQQPDEIGRLGIYRVLKVLGAGGMGVVYKAEDPKLERLVAIKAMLPDIAESASAKKRFLREAKAAAAIKHNHIVTIHQVDEDRGIPFLAMEFLEGEPLDDRLKRESTLPLAETMRIGREMAEGLAAAHERGLIHRDIKPANTWLEGKKAHVKILDFGLARAETDKAHLTQSGAIIGTPAYMSPEQGRGEKLDARSDLWSLGVVLYRMCTGEVPFKGTDTLTTLMAVVTNNPPPPTEVNAEVPAGLSDLVMKLLEKDPAKRIASAQEVAEALRELEQTSQTTKVTAGPVAKKAITQRKAAPKAEANTAKRQPTAGRARLLPSRKLPWIAIAGALAAVAVVALGIVFFWPTQGGVIRVEINDPDIEAAFAQDGLTFKGKDKEQIKVTPGKEVGLHIKRGDFEFDTDKFILKNGETVTLRIEWFKEGKLQVVHGDKVIGEKIVRPVPIASPPSPPVDLLKLIEPEKHQVNGKWILDGPVLESTMGGVHLLKIPYTPAEEYEVRLVAERKNGVECFVVGLVAGKRQFCVMIDGWTGQINGLEAFDGKGAKDYETSREGHVFVNQKGPQLAVGVPTEIVCTVREKHITVAVAGQKIIDWQGDFQRLSPNQSWNVPDSKVLSLGSCNSVFRISKLAYQTLAIAEKKLNVRPTRFTNSLGMEFVLVPKGKSWLGGGGKEGTTEVNMAQDFYLGVYEVTQEEWQKIMGKNPSRFNRANVGKEVGDDELKRFPVEQVSWDDAQAFVKLLNEKVKKDGKEAGWEYRLPTEEQWEYACRGGAMTDKAESAFDYYFEKPSNALSKDLANFAGSGLKRPSKVGSYPPNRLGLYDMHGNVWEWCEDQIDPKGGPARVIRGGGWYRDADYCRAAYRPGSAPSDRNGYLGFRLARVPSSEAKVAEKPPFVPLSLAEKEAKKLQEDTAAKLKLPVEATNKIGMKLVLIPPAGAALPEAYYLGKYEVTQGEWEKVMRYNPSLFGPLNAKVANTSKFPVEQVTWFDCVEFCNKLSEQEGLKPYYQLTVTKRPGKQIDAAEVKILGGNGYHIPTEAQWEHGCRAGTKTLYHFGDKDADLPDYAWFSQNRTHGAGEKKPNAFGLYDMHGNVWEWCEDQFDPKGPARVSRGGGWDYLAEFCRAAVRCEDAPSVRRSRLGFRLARVPSASNKFTNSLGMGFALVPKGKSWLGGGGGQVGTKEVDIPQDFYLGVYEVTQEEWQKIMGKDPSHFTREKVSKEVGDDELKRFPVEQVSWDDAKEFVKRVNEAVKKDGKEAGWEYRLPTEEQWEYACRGGTMTDKAESAFDYYFEKPSNAMSTKQGNFRDSGLQRPCKVDSYSPNRLGLYGMHDNVGEWCADEIPVDPKGGRLQICRGGGWSNDAANCRANVRHALPWSLTDQNIGLRLARIRAGAQASTTFTNSLGMEFALVPKGKSWLGGGNGQVGTKEVDIPQDFYLGVYEVTQEEWQKIMGKNPSGFTRANVGKEIGDDELKRFPVEQVSWEDAKAFVQLVNEKLKKDGNEAGWQYRLPTEQQWEYACRGGPMTDKAESAFDYYFEKPSKTLSKDQANFNETGLQRTNKVGSYPPNRLGLHDMHGNVWEWCEDQLDPKEGPARVCRGGAWVNDGAKICRAACRYSNVPSGRHIDLGFRLARVPVGPATGKKFTNSLGIEFALVPKGKSWLGGGGGKEGTTEVNMAQDFYLGAYLVTQEEWQKIMGKNPSAFNRERVGKEIGDDELKRFPVESVSWDDAKEFVKLLNEKVKKDGKEVGWEYRLPTEQQWEYACRGGPMADQAESAFDFYFEKPTNTLSKDRANFVDSGLKRPSKVGSYPPNRLGLYDLHGNVGVWCLDEHGPSQRGLRGGSWYSVVDYSRAARSAWHGQAERLSRVGLRLARVPSPGK